jgi:HD-GYP domain-containing protein (c-di-GMP phosphodiesterase class II)
LRPLVPFVLHHHEYYDGQGYPDGIAGEDIPFGARILSVADVFEAMTSNRPYRKALSPEMAVQTLLAGRGKQFDPRMVDAFMEVLKLGNT